MSLIEWLVIVLITIVIVETAVWTCYPELLLDLAERLYDRPWLNQLIHGVGALAVLAVLLNHLTATEIVAVSLFVALVSGMIATPFGARGVVAVREVLSERQGRIWPHLLVPWLIIVGLSLWALVELTS